MTNGTPAPPAPDPDKKAAHEFLAEMRTRITTQPLAYQYGVESRALESLWEIFAQARDVIKKNTGCARFAEITTRVLNVDVRPVTAKWHRAKEEGRLASRDGADEFRADLMRLQERLREFALELQGMAYGTADEDELTPDAISEPELDRCFATVRFQIDLGAPVSANATPQEQQAAAAAALAARQMRDLEGKDIKARRRAWRLPGGDGEDAPVNVVGLALSGGGVRSATFCLGVAQALAQRALFSQVDVLSTVSGGGYAGAFLAGTLDRTQNEAAVAHPLGPDPTDVRRLRLQAKFLAAANLKEGWGRVTAALAGLLLNWTAPLLVVAVIALAAFAAHVPGEGPNWGLDDVAQGFKLASIATGVALLLYAVAMRLGDRASSWAGWLLALLCAFTLGVAAIWLAVRVYIWVWPPKSVAGSLSVSILAALSTIGPMMMRFLPILRDPNSRKLILKGVLYVAAVVIPLLALLGVYFCYSIAVSSTVAAGAEWWDPRHYEGWQRLAAIAVAAGVVSFYFLNINATSPHRLYRDGLARTFIGDGASALREALKDMNQSGKAPYHLINGTLNLPSSQAVALRDRRADFFLMSKYRCGSPATGYSETVRWKNGYRDLDVATSIAVSGAAVAPHMGLGDMPTLTALLTFLNVRLGIWLRRPGTRSPFRVPGFMCLLREMTGIGMSEKAPWLNISDGGHIENLGLVELLRRRCKFIISVDAEADPEFTFGGFMTAVRHAQIDLGVRIDARLNELRADPATGLCKRHALLCRVHYPLPSGAEEIGLLLYLKLSVTGNESELIKRYRITHPAFPHQSTLDQFFDEEQFEAYRQLGVHVAEGLFSPAVTDHKTSPRTIADWFRSLAKNLLEP